jgi:hypothetical protein
MSPTLHTVRITYAVAAAIQIDNLGELKARLGIKRVGKSAAPNFDITGTLDDLETFAGQCERHDGFDMPPQTIHACNKTARRIKAFVAESRAGKDLA